MLPFRRTARCGAPWAALLWLLAAPGCGDDRATASAPQAPREEVVELLTLGPELLVNRVEIPGQLTAEMTVEISPENDGMLASIEFAEGENVSKGRVLFRMKNDAERARLREAEASLALAQATWRRTQMLAERNVSSAAQLERAAGERDVARARVDSARVALAETVIQAPFDGVMGALFVAIGDHVNDEVVMTRIDAIDRLQLVFNLPEIAVRLVRPGIPVQIRVAPYPERHFDGEVYFVSPTLDPEARRMLVKAWIPNPDHVLRPGLFAEIEAEIERKEAALLVPESALLHALDGTYVWRVGDESRVERVRVETGLHSEGRVEVAGGLAAGDRVVATGVHKLQPGGRVRAAGEPSLPRETAEETSEDRDAS